MFQNKFLILSDIPPISIFSLHSIGLSNGKTVTTENKEAQLVPTLTGTTQNVVPPPHSQLSMTPASFFTLPSEETEAQGKKRGSRAVLALFPEIIACDNHCPTPRATRAVPVGTDRTGSPSHRQTNTNKNTRFPIGEGSGTRAPGDRVYSLNNEPSGGPRLPPELLPDEDTATHLRLQRTRLRAPRPPSTLRAGSAKRYGCRPQLSSAPSGSAGAC